MPHDCLLSRYSRRMNSPHKGPVKRKMFQFDDAIMLEILLVGGHPVQEQYYYIMRTHNLVIAILFCLDLVSEAGQGPFPI